jgi:predicted DNA-binding protein (MmcQ/YjbR family)
MDIDWVREYCLALPHTTEKVQWENDLVFKIGEKMYAVVALEPGDHWLAFKCSPMSLALWWSAGELFPRHTWLERSG